ncbi:CAP-Gly domain-containing linker protein 1-like [Gambusia affinis]|uniref:CAP-Gly domain-containing linker protein 1-like n=1 Tax=Gambusia affinis TaxID=33528 RepID=UPI001CDCFA64|nr:CAP-Gly domain-containing linker protein 1-like [Gambusia affinis]
MEIQMKEFFEEEAQCQEDGRKNSQNQDAGNSSEEEVNRLKTLLDAERAKFIEEHQRANDLEEELQRVKLKLEKCEFNGNDVDLCSEANKGTNKLLMENKALQEVLAKLETDIVNLAEQVETLQEELEIEKSANTQTKTNNSFFKILKGENPAQTTEIKKALTLLKKTSAEKERHLKEELKKMTDSYQDLQSNYDTSVKTLGQQVESLQMNLRDNEEAHAEVLKMNQMLYSDLESENEALRGQLSSLQNATTEKETCLQRELDQMKEENLEMTKKLETDVLTLKKRVCSLERELKDDKEAHDEMAKINKLLYAQLQAENETLHQKLDSTQDASKEAERCIQKELDQVKDATLEMVQKYEVDILALREEIQSMEQEHRDERYRHAEVEIRNGKRAKFLHAEKNLLQKELDEVKRKLFLNEVKHKEELDASTAEIERQLARNHQISEELKQKDQEIAEAKAPLPVKKSLMKKFRHALGLRKPEKWKRKKASEETV